jgi:acetoin utilization protein AcuB
MKEYNIRHLPVVKNNKLVGILSSGDIRRASPSYATSLSVWELQYLWERIRVENVMTQRVITVGPDVTVIAAVRLMLENRFNSLPVVVASGQVVGMLTEVDIFHLLIQESENMSKSLANSQSEIQVAATP